MGLHAEGWKSAEDFGAKIKEELEKRERRGKRQKKCDNIAGNVNRRVDRSGEEKEG